jgi:hypothetical protein
MRDRLTRIFLMTLAAPVAALGLSGVLGAVAQVSGPGRLSLGVYGDRALNLKDERQGAEAGIVVYEPEFSGGVLRLLPKFKQTGIGGRQPSDILGLWKGNAALGLDYANYQDIAYGPANIVLDTRNESRSRIQITGGYLEVVESMTDLQPLLRLEGPDLCELQDASGFGGLKFLPRFPFVNYGWGKVEDARLTYAFSAPGSVRRTNSFRDTLGTFLDTKNASVLSGLKSLGVDVGRLERGAFPCPSKAAAPQCLRQLVTDGVLGSVPVYDRKGTVYTDVGGEIEYAWTDAKGASHQRRSPFAFPMPLLAFQGAEGQDCGALPPADLDHPVITLRLDEANYRIPIQYRATLGPGQTMRLGLSLQAEKASRHTFRAVLRLSDNATVPSGPIDLLYFKPRLPIDR